MPRCKYCDELISRLDKDVCPFCGGLKPLEGVDNSTEDLTKAFSAIKEDDVVKHRKKITACLLYIFLGVFGVADFYLGYKRRGLIAILVSLVLIGGVGSAIFFTAWQSPLAYLVFYFAIELVMIFAGLSYLFRHDLVDADGEFLR